MSRSALNLLVIIALLAAMAFATSDSNEFAVANPQQSSLSMDMSSAFELEQEFLGMVQRDPKLAEEVEKLGDIYCSGCTTVIQTIISKGCAYGCRAIPNPIASAICGWIIGKADLCRRIMDWAIKGDSVSSVCKKIGFCNRSCQCGVCTPAIVNSGRCMGLVTSCGNPYYRLTLSDMFSLSEESRNFSADPAEQEKQADPESVGWCVRGSCDSSSKYGCCLTCF